MKRLLPYSILLVVGLLLIIFESDYLYRVQEQNLFLHTSLFFQQRMVVSGGLLTWAGACLTQLFHYPALGIAVLCLLWALLMLLLKQAFRISCRWRWITLLPIACLLLTVTDLGYWIAAGSLLGLGLSLLASEVWHSFPIYRPLHLRQLSSLRLLRPLGNGIDGTSFMAY